MCRNRTRPRSRDRVPPSPVRSPRNSRVGCYSSAPSPVWVEGRLGSGTASWVGRRYPAVSNPRSWCRTVLFHPLIQKKTCWHRMFNSSLIIFAKIGSNFSKVYWTVVRIRSNFFRIRTHNTVRKCTKRYNCDMNYKQILWSKNHLQTHYKYIVMYFFWFSNISLLFVISGYFFLNQIS